MIKAQTKNALLWIFQHVCLPPRLPSGEGDNQFIRELVTLLHASLKKFQPLQVGTDTNLLEEAIVGIESFQNSQGAHGGVSEKHLKELLNSLSEHGGPIILHIEAQNAGILIRKTFSEVVFEIFRLSPPNEVIYRNPGRLKRSFPEVAVAVPREILDDPDFRATVACTLETMSCQSVAEMQPQASKANKLQIEERDTVKSFVVTKLFLAMVQAVGGSEIQVPALWKHTREEVMWNHGNKLPWRRSPIWLLLRVALQQILSPSVASGEPCHALYKRFIVFFMSTFLEMCLATDMDSDTLHVINAKLARRLIKLKVQKHEGWMTTVEEVMQRATQKLDFRWNRIIEADTITLDIPSLEAPRVRKDLSIDIPTLDFYLESISQRGSPKSTGFHPHRPDIQFWDKRLLPDFKQSIRGTGPYQLYNLALLEDWVEEHLDNWLDQNTDDDKECGKIQKIIQNYSNAASRAYQGRPEGMSVMLLTVLELWIACDKIAIKLCPLIASYKPEIPVELWQSLMLKSARNMKRVFVVEKYILQRRQAATFSRSILFDFGSSSDFGIQLFAKSPSHQSLLQEIEENATQARRQKREEFQRAKLEYQKLMSEHDSLECTYARQLNKWGDEVSVHASWCRRCLVRNQAQLMSIRAHEWPLPQDQISAQAVVFELRVPKAFGVWRDCTLYVLQNVFQFLPEGHSPRYACHLGSYSELVGYHQAHSSTVAVGLLSDVKPHAETHRRDINVSTAQESDVCLETGPRWHLFDHTTSRLLAPLRVSEHISSACTLPLPEVSQELETFLARPWTAPDGISPNSVIANQHKCPDHFSIEEFKVLCTLPLGRYVQWPNILLQLAMPSIDMNKIESFVFIWQSSEQCGPSSNIWQRASHRRLCDSGFVCACLDHLQHCLTRAKESWELRTSVATFTLLGTRILSLSSSEHSTACLQFLSNCRNTSYQWQHTLRQKAFTSQDNEVRLDFAQRAYEAALVCLLSFDVDDDHISGLLEQPEIAMAYFESLITLHDTAFGADTRNLLQTQLGLRCHRMIKRYHQAIQRATTNNWADGLDLAVKENWSNLERVPGRQWRMMEICWLCSAGEITSDGSSQLTLHLNLITGEFLVDGLLPGRLPTEYERHPTYELLFGHVAFEALPIADAGMKFSAAKTFHGFGLQFLLNNSSNDLIVRAQKGEQSWELIPERLFQGILPSTFSAGYFYFYELRKLQINLASKKHPWSTDSRSWTMEQSSSGWSLQDGGTNQLVFPLTDSAQTYGVIFAPLETILGLEIMFKSQEETMEIHIPRLHLDFSIAHGSDAIQSRQYRGMSVDKVQGIRTLIGLRSRLVLISHKNNAACRSVLIPDGVPMLSSKSLGDDTSHVLVQTRDAALSTQLYSLNDYLGQLVGNGTLKSRLFLAELHAVTSGSIADPYTGHTGTQEALAILNSAAVMSLGFNDNQEVSIMERIARLAPSRTYYPEHLREMQLVVWHSVLSPLVQTDAFALVATKLQEQAERLKFLQPIPESLENLKIPYSELTSRGLSRSPCPYHVDDIPPPHDVVYDGKVEATSMMKRAAQAIRYGSAIYRGEGILFEPGSNFSAIGFYNLLKGERDTAGASRTTPSSEFQYDARYLEDPSSLLPSMWCQFHWELTRTEHGCSRFQLASWLTTFAFAPDANTACLQALLSFATLPGMRGFEIPLNHNYDLRKGFNYKSGMIRDTFQNQKIDFANSSEASLPRHSHETNQSASNRRNNLFQTKVNEEVAKIEEYLRTQWPSSMPVFGGADLSYFHSHQASETVRGLFRAWYDNLKFNQYLTEVCQVLTDADTVDINVPKSIFRQVKDTPSSCLRSLEVLDLVKLLHAPTLPKNHPIQHGIKLGNTQGHQRSNHLELLSTSLRGKVTSKQELLYLDKLDQSISSLHVDPDQSKISCSKDEIIAHIHILEQQASNHYDEVLQLIRATLKLEVDVASINQHVGASWRVASSTHYWPQSSIRHLLALMKQRNWVKVPAPWKVAIVELAVSLANLQAVRRLGRACNSEQDLIQELRSMRERSWNPVEFPDSLLLEVEGDLRIREVQEEIAAVMRAPPDGQNAVMQLNMGEGKSTVIVPIVAAYLADGSRLVRVIVAKPQSRQMFHILVSKLGGLLGRRIYQMPLSRSTSLDELEINILDQHYRQCVLNGGIMLVQPEHLLSFQLMTIEKAILHETILAGALWKLHEFFSSSSRDIVDESDENFSTRFELIYTMGEQRAIEHGPDRWIVIQGILAIVAEYARKAKRLFPKGIELDEQGRSSFPLIRFLNKEAGCKVLSQAASCICHGGIHGFPISHETEKMRLNLLSYVLDVEPDPLTQFSVENSEFWKHFSSNVLLLRGLFAGGVLEHIFGQKRWRVNYGLDSRREPRTRLAVPYHAKDSPTASSEFSHPDVVIGLTCLSYYYGGLSNEDQTLSLENLLRSDQADVEYQQWVDSSDGLPNSLQHTQSINLQDKEQCETSIFPHFRYSKGAVDYFLSHLVFKKEMKEFPHKLSASGWDLGRNKNHPLTGFSGTNDSQHVLPVSIRQLELGKQRHTNALVLDYLMRPENSVVCLTEVGLEGICNSKAFLSLIINMVPRVRVVLDVGALMLDMNNEQFVQEWLRITESHVDVQAAVFCNSVDEVCVLDRRGHIEPLTASPFAEQLDRCVVFLDEAHTRGIDLRLPSHYRAAVTLGAGVTKDRLVQACMRLRKLAFGQSVSFYVPEEIETQIRELTLDAHDQPLSVMHVLEWAMRNTWVDLRRSMPLWLNQGQVFAKQKMLWERARAGNGRALIVDDLAKEYLEDEAQSLEGRYRPRDPNKMDLETTQACDEEILKRIVERCHQFEGLDLVSGALQEEQERELAPEIEQQRQLERPAPAVPANHRLHPDLVSFVTSGKIVRRKGDDAFMWAFEAFKNTTLCQDFNVDNLPHGLLVTKDFERTIMTNKIEPCMDSYQRPVQWVLTNRSTNNATSVMVILSPFEANELIPRIERLNLVVLHLYAPQHNKAYRPLDSLALFPIPLRVNIAIPTRLRIELMLFSGQLYFESFEQYVDVCDFLCLAHDPASSSMVVKSDGFIDPQSHDESRDRDLILKESPIKFLKSVVTRIRRQCEGIEKTHLGMMLEGVLLVNDHFKCREMEA